MKVLMHFVPRRGAEEGFASAIGAVAAELRQHPEAAEIRVNAMHRLENDPFGKKTLQRAALELTGEVRAQAIETLTAGLGARLGEVAHPDLSSLLIGEDVVFVPSDRAPVRYQYLMRRNASFSHDAYLKRYREIHSKFGIATPGILGYVQFYVDPEASRRAAGRAGLGVWAVDSVSELHLASLEAFIGQVATWSGADAMADEEIFVDRGSSFDFCSAVEWDDRIGSS